MPRRRHSTDRALLRGWADSQGDEALEALRTAARQVVALKAPTAVGMSRERLQAIDRVTRRGVEAGGFAAVESTTAYASSTPSSAPTAPSAGSTDAANFSTTARSVHHRFVHVVSVCIRVNRWSILLLSFSRGLDCLSVHRASSVMIRGPSRALRRASVWQRRSCAGRSPGSQPLGG